MSTPARKRPASRRGRKAVGLPIVVDGRVIQDRYHGIGRQTFELVRGLIERGVAVELLYSDVAATRLSVHNLPALDNLRLVEFRAGVTSLTQQRLWASVLRGLRGQLLIVPYHLAVPWVSPIPRATFVHDCIFEEDPGFAPPGPTRYLYRSTTRLAIARSDLLLTVSDATRVRIAHHYGRRLGVNSIVRSGVDSRFGVRLSEHKTAEVRARLDVPDRYILHVGARRPHKNQVMLVRSFRRLLDLEPPVHLVLVGGADDRFRDAAADELRAHGSTRVRRIESVTDTDLRVLYQGAAVFAFPSLVEGYGLPVLEAMAAGAPVVASTTAAVAEAAGGAALLASPYDAMTWAEALRSVLTDPALAKSLRERGRIVAAAANWERSVDDLERGLQPLVDRIAGRP